MRRYLAVQALESGNTAGHDLLAGSAGVAYGQANGGMPAFFAADSASGKVGTSSSSILPARLMDDES